MSDKRKFPYDFAAALANKLVLALGPHCERILICGSLRRRKPEVGDIEIVYIPKLTTEQNPESLFPDPLPVNLTDRAIDELIARGTLAKRLVATNTWRPNALPLPRGEGQGEGQTGNPSGHPSWGAKNKLAILVKTGVPVDLFAATAENWHNYIVCRTGSAETNTRIATLANQRGFRWNPYGSGFTSIDHAVVATVTRESDVFQFVGLPWLEPEQR